MTDLEFYEKCAEILGQEFQSTPFEHYKRTRWNNRKPGNGRFKGFGLIRIYGNMVHISNRKVNKLFNSKELALEWLSGGMVTAKSS